MGFQWMCFPTSQIEINIRFFVLLLKEMQHNSLKSMKKSMKIIEKISIFEINLRLYILHNIQWFKYEPTSGHWFLVGRFYRVRTMIVTLKIVPKKLGSMVFQWHGHYVCQSESSHLYTASSFSSPHTFNSSSPLSVSSPSLYNKWNGSRHDKKTKWG